MPRLTMLTPILPTSPLVGGTIHTVRVLQQLARRYHVNLYALVTHPASDAWPPLLDICEEVHTVARPLRPSAGFAAPAVRLDHSVELAAQLQRDWKQRPPDVVQLEFTTMAQYAPLARATGALTVCTAHNVAFLAQIRRARRQRGWALKVRRWLGALSLWMYELRALAQCDLVVTLSQADATALARWLPRLRVVYLPSGVDLHAQPVSFDPQAANHVLFVGSYQHPPNVEGALWLAREVWPLVRRACPNAHLTLAGRAPGPDIRALAAADIRVPGTLDDLSALYRCTSVMVAPIFWGSGVRIKILDALAAGLPLVTTPEAAEDIPLIHGKSALFAINPEDFAAAIVRLLDDVHLRAQLSRAGRSLVEREYDWERIGERLVGLYEEARHKR